MGALCGTARRARWCAAGAPIGHPSGWRRGVRPRPRAQEGWLCKCRSTRARPARPAPRDAPPPLRLRPTPAPPPSSPPPPGHVPLLCAVDPLPPRPAAAAQPVDQRGAVGVQVPNALHPQPRVPVAGGAHRVCDQGERGVAGRGGRRGGGIWGGGAGERLAAAAGSPAAPPACGAGATRGLHGAGAPPAAPLPGTGALPDPLHKHILLPPPYTPPAGGGGRGGARDPGPVPPRVRGPAGGAGD